MAARPPVKSYEDLIVYQKSLVLASRILTITKSFPRAERYELVSQIRRAAVSIPSNIVEGYSRRSRKDYVHFLSIAYGSCRELDTHLHISLLQKFIYGSEFREVNSLRDEVAAMLWKLMESLSPASNTQQPVVRP